MILNMLVTIHGLPKGSYIKVHSPGPGQMPPENDGPGQDFSMDPNEISTRR